MNKAKEIPKARLPQTFMEAAADFERSKTEEMAKSRKTAWAVAGVSLFVTVISISSLLVAMLFRTEPEPTILRVDNSTGFTSVMRSIKDSQDHYDEVVDKFFLADYVREREGYDWWSISTAVDKVNLMSMPNVASAYMANVKDKQSPLNTLADKGKIVAKIISISFVGNTAQVRYTTQKTSANGATDGSPLQKWIATIAYRYESKMMTEQQRLVNPLGFKAVSYRVDPEVLQ